MEKTTATTETTTATSARTASLQGQEKVASTDRKKMKVMVALDDSDSSFYALTWALDHLFTTSIGVAAAPAKEFPEEVDMLFLVHVQQPFHHYAYPVGPGGTAIYATSSVVESVRKAQEEISTALLSRALEMCKAKAKAKLVKAETLILDGDPKDMICQASEQMNVDLLVLGSRGLGKIKRAFLGSVSDYCAHHASCPILIVKPSKEAARVG
ncbi:universal stress protein PHOS34 isoform X1 [Ziziphus jujuba]|uniref:Universal stress protein PHOS34 isoform X1 n=1 Tax=Ziziphus jujuba TaxID=326968 RepID=A0A6P6FTD1_ZIZJJ|nr:universal stress protein PHOS34 isoform X1 [Ziziphus jujuba]